RFERNGGRKKPRPKSRVSRASTRRFGHLSPALRASVAPSSISGATRGSRRYPVCSALLAAGRASVKAPKPKWHPRRRRGAQSRRHGSFAANEGFTGLAVAVAPTRTCPWGFELFVAGAP